MSTDDDRIEKALTRLLERSGGGSSSIEAIVAENPDLEVPLRARIRVARMLDVLREAPTAGPQTPGVVESLSRAGRSVRPVSLPDPASDEPSPVVFPKTPSGRWGRYTVEGEIARGGVGVVLKARDPDLGRDVALKVLREEQATQPDVLQRFVEEAQIGGQLQHPGVVPVYELGLGSDQQPYFVMKLVKGKTLASLLAERESPASDRLRFLAVFQAVCQTLAYAHERRIVHRDVKPSNVMVGAFGEVQVLDWGMAKVLARGGAADDARAAEEPAPAVCTVRSASGSAPSVEGSVLGTPQYMAPEQARGEVDRLDERSDVFSLGATLCEVLTGKAPYTGTDREVLQAAARADLEPVHARLRSCGADSSLVALAIRCLAAEKADRPRDAGTLAREVTAYLASLEARTRAAEVAAAEARVVATQERRARRLTRSLSLAMVALFLAGGGGWIWVDRQRRDRADAVDRQVAAALDDVTRLRSKAEASDAEESLPLWHEALASARQAERLAKSGDADQAIREHTRVAASQIADAQQRARSAAEEHRRDAAMVAKLDEIRGLAGENWNWRAASAAYASALEEHLGLDVRTANTDESTRRIIASPIHDRLALAIDDWVDAKFEAAEDETALRAVAARVDASPWRNRLRQTKGELRAVKTCASEANLSTLSARDILFLADALGSAGDPEAAADVAQEAWRQSPGDFWACFTTAKWNQQCHPPRREAAMRFYTAALAARPRSTIVHVNVGALLWSQGDLDGAIAEDREAIRLDPGFGYPHHNLGLALRGKGDLEGAVTEHREAVRLDPKDAMAHGGLGAALHVMGQHDAAIAELQEAIRLDPKLAEAHAILGAALGEKGKLGEAIAECREAIRLDPKNAKAHLNLGRAFDGTGQHDAEIAEYREAIRLDPKDAMAHNNLGDALSDKGDLDGAVTECREAIRLDPSLAAPHENLAIALRSLGHLRGSLDEFRIAHEIGSSWRMAWLSDQLHGAEGLVAAEEKLPAFVRGEAQPVTLQDALNMARAGYLVASYAAACTAWERAFAMDPARVEDLESGNRYNAACSAALVGSGKGKDAAMLDDASRARRRRQAIEWLRADFVARGGAADPKTLRATLEHWTKDADLASLRDEAAVATLPAEEQVACRALWHDVRAVLDGGRGSAK